MHLAHLAVLAAAAAYLRCSTGSAITGPGDGTVGPPASGPVVDVAVRDFAFSPATVTVRAGTTVRWTNRGPSPHTSTSDDGAWDSSVLRPPSSGDGHGGGPAGWSFAYTFVQAGTYGYHCTIHPPSQFPAFTGVVTVTP